MQKINELLLLKIKYKDNRPVNWADVAAELGTSVETLRKLRFEGFYDGLRWEQIQKLAKLLDMKVWELVKAVEEGNNVN